MNLNDLGFNEDIADCLKGQDISDFSVGRVIREHRERYVVSDGENEYETEITGNLRFSANSRADFPAVGDWVVMKIYNSDKAIIHNILPRKSVLERQAVGKFAETQIISTNIDTAFIIQSLNNNFNVNRLERYLTICYSANIEPVLVISKIDLSTDKEIQNTISELQKRDRKVKYILLSNKTLTGLDQIMNFIKRGNTYCVIGSSGVGKSTLINNLLKKNILKTGLISLSTNKGRHTTGHRELFVLENGGIIIDTPGMKELGMTNNSEGVIETFQDIVEISRNCKFTDCKHINESGCAVIDALRSGIINQALYDNYQRINKEQERFQTSAAEKRRKDRAFGKMIRDYYKNKKSEF